MARVLFNVFRATLAAGYVLIGLCTVSFAQGSGYRLNPGDQLLVSVWREDGLTRELVVLPDGTIGFPLVGSLAVAGLTPSEAEEALEEQLIKTIKSPQATIVVTAVTGNRVYVLGKVKAPGAYTLQSRMSVPQVISLAGGFAEFAKESRVSILRRSDSGTFDRIGIDLTKILTGDVSGAEIAQYLQAGDMVVVP